MMKNFILQKIRSHSALRTCFVLGGAAMISGIATAAPQSSVVEAPLASTIASPTSDLNTRPAARPQKTEAVTRPGNPDGASKTDPMKISINIGSSVIAAPETKIATPKVVVKPAGKSAQDKAAEAKAREEKLLLSQLEADLARTEKRLDTTSEKLSAGQKELLSLNNTLRTVMNDSGEDASGLHPFVRVASRYAGTPYVWGGESRYGFDCSGFIIRVMRDLGYKALPHSAAEQFKYGTPIAQSLLKPGDIVFFANTYKPGISHVGIYIGKRRFIHAASTREGTIISSLDASPYKQKYAGARRLNAVNKSA